MDLARKNPSLRNGLLLATRPIWNPSRMIVNSLFRQGANKPATSPLDSEKKRILVVSAIQDGGLAKISKEIFTGLGQQFDVFFTKLNNFEISAEHESQKIFLARGNFLLDNFQNNPRFDKEFLNLIRLVKPDIIHLEHLNKISHSVISQLKTQNIFISHTIHDYFDLCPSHNLLDEKLVFCGGVCTKGEGWCDISLIAPGDIKKIKNDFVHQWRELNNSLLQQMNVIFSPSSHSAELFLETYPTLRNILQVVPHGVSQDPKFLKKIRNKNLEKVLFLGNYLPAKGSKKLRALAIAGAKKNITFYHLGRAPLQFRKWAKLLGPYVENDLPRILSEVNPDCVVVASIWPETFGLVVDEAAAMGLPIISLALGEISERVLQEGIGLVLDPDATPDTVLLDIQKFLHDTNAVNQASQGLERFSAGLGGRHSRMINSYKVVFENA
jgi:glycosyltransferase involved in cell wall biosynthesis